MHLRTAGILAKSLAAAAHPVQYAAGIGKAVVTEMAALGASVFTCARSESTLQEALAAWKRKGLDVEGIASDVRDPAACEALVSAVSERFNGATLLQHAFLHLTQYVLLSNLPPDRATQF